MIKEYDEVKRFVDTKVSSKYLDAAVFVSEIYTDEYNALDVSISGNVKVSSEYYLQLQNILNKEFPNVINDFQIIETIIPNHTSIIIYLRPTLEIRSEKISKIKNNILV